MNRIQKLLIIILLVNTVLISKDYNGGSHSITIVFPKTALLDIGSEGVEDISFSMNDPYMNGKFLSNSSGNRIWIDVTSIVDPGDTRNISVKIVEPIPEIDLKIICIRNTASGFSPLGIPKAELSLTTSDQLLVSRIENICALNRINSGLNLKYITEINNSKIEKNRNILVDEITVIYTLTD